VRLWDDRTVTTFAEPDGTATALLLLGRGRDQASERGVDCPGDLPAPSDPTLVARAKAAKAALGDKLFVLGHHYQRDEVIQFADVTGDSFKLARDAAARPDAEYIVFCGVHFMAESADILTGPDQKVVLPDLAAGCSMADMAAISQVEAAWDVLEEIGAAESTVPVTYMNSTAAIKGSSAATAAWSAPRRTPSGRWTGPSSAGSGCCSCPTSTWDATRPCSSSASPPTTACSTTRTRSPTKRRWAAGSARRSCARRR
jgi:hypothetical protein